MTDHSRWCSLQVALITPVLMSCANELAPGDREIIDRWLHCAECRSGERAAVRAIGPRAVPTLVKALEGGPPAEYRDNMRRKVNTLYTSIKTTASGPDSSALPRTAYVERGVANYEATYRKRAAVSLGDIGTPEAVSALQAAAPPGGTIHRADVIEAIRAAQATSDTARFLGSITPRTPAFGDTVIVRPPAFEPFDGNELASIEGSPIAPNATKVFGDSARFAFIAVGFPGQRRLTIQNVDTTTHSQHAEIALRTLSDANDRRMAGCADPACRINRAPRYTGVSVPFSSFLTLWRTASSADTVDMVKFEPSSHLLHLTADLSWSPTTANLDLRWADCATSAAVGNADGATGNHPERSVVNVPGGRCWVLIVLLSSTGIVSPVIAHLRISP